MNRYSTYGLTIHSNVDLPLWPATGNGGNGLPDILIEETERRPFLRELPKEGYDLQVRPERAELHCSGVGSILVSANRPIRMEARPLPEASNRLISHFLSGSALALALHYHGFLPLHGCALRIHGKTVIIMGQRGHGKSTLCAALCKLGHQIITDDISPVSWIGDRAHVMPGYPQIKLNQDVVDRLKIAPEEITPLHEIHPKVAWFRPRDRFTGSLPVDGLYLLAIGKRGIRRLNGLDAFGGIQRHATPSQWLFEGGKGHFLACSRLIGEVPVHAFARERDLDGLMDQAEWFSSCLREKKI